MANNWRVLIAANLLERSAQCTGLCKPRWAHTYVHGPQRSGDVCRHPHYMVAGPETMHRELSAVKTHAGVHVQQDNIIWHFLYVDGESCMEPRDHHPSLQVIVFGKDIGTNYMYGHMICTFRDVFHPMPNKKYMPPRNVMCFTLKLRIRVHVATQMFLGKLWHRVPDRIQEFNPAVVDQMQLWPTLD